MLGQGFLSHFVITYDYSRKQMLVSPPVPQTP